MLSYHVSERMKEDFKRSLFFVILFPLYLIHDLIEVGYDIMRIVGSFEYKFILVGYRMDDDIPLTKNRIEEGWGVDFCPFYIGVFHIKYMSREYIPIDVDEPLICDYPDVIVPIKYLIKQIKIQEDNIYLEIIKWDEILDGERIIVIEKSGDKESEKECQYDAVNNEDDMFVADKKEFFPLSEIFGEKSLIEVIHKKGI